MVRAAMRTIQDSRGPEAWYRKGMNPMRSEGDQ